MAAASPDPKPHRRRLTTSDSEACRAKVQAEGRCRVCGRVPSGHPLDSLNRMHLVGGSLREWDPDGVVPGCGSGTTGCHGVLTTKPRGWQAVASRLRANLRPEEIAYVIRVKGEAYLDEHYPEGVTDAS